MEQERTTQHAASAANIKERINIANVNEPGFMISHRCTGRQKTNLEINISQLQAKALRTVQTYANQVLERPGPHIDKGLDFVVRNENLINPSATSSR